jgi:hypothetical protein
MGKMKKKKKEKKAITRVGNVAQVLENLLNKYEALNQTLIRPKKKKKKASAVFSTMVFRSSLFHRAAIGTEVRGRGCRYQLCLPDG